MTRSLFTVTIHTADTRMPAGKLADAELRFTDDAGPLAGLKLVGFAVWDRRGGSRNITVPARQYTVNGERRSFALLRPDTDASGLDQLKTAILDAYERHQDGPERTPETPVHFAQSAAGTLDVPPAPGSLADVRARANDAIVDAAREALALQAPIIAGPHGGATRSLFEMPEAAAVTLPAETVATVRADLAAIAAAAASVASARATVAEVRAALAELTAPTSAPIPLIATRPDERAVYTPPSVRRRPAAPQFPAGTAAAEMFGLL